MPLTWSTAVRISTATAEASTRLREAALRVPVPSDGPWAGKRVRVSLDGGRVRLRRTHRGRTTAKGRHCGGGVGGVWACCPARQSTFLFARRGN